MPSTPVIGRIEPVDAVPARGPRPRAAGENEMTPLSEMTLLSQDLSRERPPVPDELAARVVALRRARREARTRASRVRRVLLAPTAAGEAYAHPQRPRHRD
ncbi:hypothetical protein GCM10023088_71260 [Actinomadura verrucosospora]